ncbi:MAG: PBP1A family penicillin-binding protein [Bryobacteraceae bacterium]
MSRRSEDSDPRQPEQPKSSPAKRTGSEKAPRAKSKSRVPARLQRFVQHPVGQAFIGITVFSLAAGLLVFFYFYNHYATLIEEKLAQGPYSTTSKLYASPQVISTGDRIEIGEIVQSLHRAGYTKNRSNRMGWYAERPGSVEVYPGADSYFQQEAHVVHVDNHRIGQIISLRDNTERPQLLLEPELITNLFDRNREKRRILRFQDIPLVMRNALLAAEDKRFFQHSGFDPFRILKAAWVDISSKQIRAGASTLSMQLARSIWLTTERTWRRKIPEILITIHLERKLSKEDIFEHYSNTIYLGRVGTFNIHGFGEGAQAYFGKSLSRVTLPEAAMLAGIVQSPSGYNPFRNPERAIKRRNLILQMMRTNGFITQEQFQTASSAPLGAAAGASESEDAPYFVDLVNDQLQRQFQDHDFQTHSYRVYTSLDLNLQRAAAEAMEAGLKEVDAALEKRGRTAKKGWPKVQAALVAIDPRTAEVRALIGGRDYATSQLNRSLAMRQPGSIFKPFVYAAALETGLDSGPGALTPASMLIDEPTTFWFDGKPYEPNNYHNSFYGSVSVRQALSKSLNVPTVKLAEQVGYQRVTQLAREAGLKSVRATPSAALGSYEARPLDMAGSYTVFANRGVFTEANWIKMIRDEGGHSIYTHKPVSRRLLDTRIAYLMTNLLEGVMSFGTGAGARSRGFRLPAAGKTGTSHDGWFAGFTTELLCVVWVGYDDNRELGLEGARSALPIWTEFMKRAHSFRPYQRATSFSAPDGVVSVEIDANSGKLASGGGCGGAVRNEVFLMGTQPIESCGGGGETQVAGWDTDVESPRAPDRSEQPRRVASREVHSIPVKPIEPPTAPQAQEPKKGLLNRILGVFR